MAGTGKSTIAQTVARQLYEEGYLGASFFFSRGGGDVGTAEKFVTSIARQLATCSPILQEQICKSVLQHRDIASQSLSDQWRRLVLQPLSKLNDKECLRFVFVIDALDECDGNDNIMAILRLLAEAHSTKPSQLRIFLTSRPEVPVRSIFYGIPAARREDFVLHEIQLKTVNHDISLFFKKQLEEISKYHGLGTGWPGGDIIQKLVNHASGLFIWAATACRFIREGRSLAADRLLTILGDNSVHDSDTDSSLMDDAAVDDFVIDPEKRLNEIYRMVLENPVRNFKRKEKKKWYKQLREAIGPIILLLSPLSALSLANLLGTAGSDIIRILNDLHSILDVQEDHTKPIHLHHPSFRDFLLDRDRCKDPNLLVDKEQAHQKLASSCIQLMSNSLKQDICGLGAPGTLLRDVASSQIEQCLPLELQYACLYWEQHLLKSGNRLYDNDFIHQFLKTHLLYWLEALSLMGKVSEGILIINSLISFASVWLP